MRRVDRQRVAQQGVEARRQFLPLHRALQDPAFERFGQDNDDVSAHGRVRQQRIGVGGHAGGAIGRHPGLDALPDLRRERFRSANTVVVKRPEDSVHRCHARVSVRALHRLVGRAESTLHQSQSQQCGGRDGRRDGITPQ